MEKKCSKCGEIKDVNMFGKNKSNKDGLQTFCTQCRTKDRQQPHIKEQRRQYKKQYIQNNPDKIKKSHQKYYQENKEKCVANIMKWQNGHKDEMKLKDKIDYQKNKEFHKKHIKDWKKANPDKVKEQKKRYNERYKCKKTLSKSIRKKLLAVGASKNGRSTFKDILPYSIQELHQHLESLFEEGMTWDNYGSGDGKWQIDHVVPESWFKYTSMEDDAFKSAWDLKNLQPLWSWQNASKSDRYAGKYNPDFDLVALDVV